jgi:hypothetical protein
MTDKLQEGEWDTEEETLASRGNGQYEPYLVVSKDEADARVAELEAENQRLREALSIIAGERQCVDNLMSNVEIAKWALQEG